MSTAKPKEGMVTSEAEVKSTKRKATPADSADESVRSIPHDADDEPLKRPTTATKSTLKPTEPDVSKTDNAATAKSRATPAARMKGPGRARVRDEASPEEIEITGSAKAPPAKKPRTTAAAKAQAAITRANIHSAAAIKKMQKPAPPCAVSVGDMGFHKSFSTSGNRTLCDKKVLVSVNEVHYDQASGNWLVLLENQGEMLPRGATWWDVEKSVELPHKKGDEVLVKVNGGFVEGIIEGVERDNEAGGWTYECDIVGTIKVAGSDKLRRVDNPHKVKVEKTFKVEGGKEGEDEGESAFKAEDA